MKTSLLLLGLAAFAPFALASDTVITPEPGTIALMATGLAGLGLAAWRAKHKK
jgi:PEP-CTERM motif